MQFHKLEGKEKNSSMASAVNGSVEMHKIISNSPTMSKGGANTSWLPNDVRERNALYRNEINLSMSGVEACFCNVGASKYKIIHEKNKAQLIEESMAKITLIKEDVKNLKSKLETKDSKISELSDIQHVLQVRQQEKGQVLEAEQILEAEIIPQKTDLEKDVDDAVGRYIEK